MDIAYFKLFVDYLDAIEPLGDAERGRLFTALLVYAKTGEAPQLVGNERFLFPMMRSQIDRDVGEYRRKSEVAAQNGRKGGRPKKAEQSEQNQKKQTLYLANEKSKDKERRKKKEDQDKDEDGSSARARVIAAYAEKINVQPSAMCLAELSEYAESLGEELCVKAMDIAMDFNARNWSYIRAILARWKAAGYRSAADVDRAEARRRAQQPQGGDANAWMDEFL